MVIKRIVFCLIVGVFLLATSANAQSGCDANGDGVGADISDLVYLVDYMFLGGPPPFPCGTVFGEVWSVQTSLTNARLEAVASGNSKYAVVGQGTILSSTDGQLWDEALSPTEQYLNDVLYADGRFVAVGSSWSNGPAIIVSTDGDTWTGASDIPLIVEGLAGITHTGSMFVAVGYASQVCTSPDGEIWTKLDIWEDGVYMSDVAWSGSQLVAVGYDFSSGGGLVSISSDGTAWSQSQICPENLSGVCWTGTEFIAVGDLGVIWASPDGTSWSERESGTSEKLRSVAKVGSLIIAVGGPEGAGVILTSENGADWTERTSGVSETLLGIGGSTSMAVAVGVNGVIVTSP